MRRCLQRDLNEGFALDFTGVVKEMLEGLTVIKGEKVVEEDEVEVNQSKIEKNNVLGLFKGCELINTYIDVNLKIIKDHRGSRTLREVTEVLQEMKETLKTVMINITPMQPQKKLSSELN